MPKRQLPKPTEAELAMLRVLCERGPSTVHVVTDALHHERGTGYTTALKLLQIMCAKGLVRRDETSRTHVYEAVASADVTQRQLLSDLLERAFGGSASRLVLQALSSRKTSREDPILTSCRVRIDGEGARNLTATYRRTANWRMAAEYLEQQRTC
jgi:predicted transcriptional regulator